MTHTKFAIAARTFAVLAAVVGARGAPREGGEVFTSTGWDCALQVVPTVSPICSN